MNAKFLMIQGTASDSGKSTIVTGLCRIFSDLGYKVAPFKSQNMSLNSFVTKEGKEIGRSQVVQAWAARREPISDFNPILLKPKGNNSSQIILDGIPFADYKVKEYYSKFIPKLIPHIYDSLNRLKKTNDLVIIEGAGSPAEINLNHIEIANMFVAKYVQSPVILTADIERGGVFASIYGTIELLKKEEKDLIKAFIINRFRGDLGILLPGITQMEGLIGKKCLGVLPFLEDLRIPAEDSLAINLNEEIKEIKSNLNIRIIKLPKISNFTDYEPFKWDPKINFKYVSKSDEIIDGDLIIIPGTKNTVTDLEWLKKNGFDEKLQKCLDNGSTIVGICGGFQMLGEKIIDSAIESNTNASYAGLGFLPIITEFRNYSKITNQVSGKIVGLNDLNGQKIKGYEIHMGKISMIDRHGIKNQEYRSLMEIKRINNDNKSSLNKKFYDGMANLQGSIIGTFVHGFWDEDEFRRNFIKRLFLKKREKKPINKDFNIDNYEIIGYKEIVEKNINRVAEIIKKHCNFDEIKRIIGL